MYFLILGSGKMAYPIASYLAEHTDAEFMICDIDKRAAEALSSKLERGRATAYKLDISADQALSTLPHRPDATVGCVSYKFNHKITEECINLGSHYCDLGGNNSVVDKQLLLDERARDANVSIIPDCGLAPGLACWLAGYESSFFEELSSIKMYVGGLPQDPKPPLNYQLVFSVQGLTNEYIEPARVIRNGKLVELPSMTEIESVSFTGDDEKLNNLEAFLTSGGTSTLVSTIQKNIETLDYKTVRYPGHCNYFNLLFDLGFNSEQPMDSESKWTPRSVLEDRLEKSLPQNQADYVVLRVEVCGINETEEKIKHSWEMIDKHDGMFTSMMRTTGFPTAVAAQLQSEGKTKTGVAPGELSLDLPEFVKRIRKALPTLNRTVSKL